MGVCLSKSGSRSLRAVNVLKKTPSEISGAVAGCCGGLAAAMVSPGYSSKLLNSCALLSVSGSTCRFPPPSWRRVHPVADVAFCPMLVRVVAGSGPAVVRVVADFGPVLSGIRSGVFMGAAGRDTGSMPGLVRVVTAFGNVVAGVVTGFSSDAIGVLSAFSSGGTERDMGSPWVSKRHR